MAADPMPFAESRAANRLLSRLFGSKDDDLHVVLFRLNPARSVSFKGIAAAASDAAGQADVYVHVGLSRRPFKGGDRPTVNEIDALGGLWADVDIAHPVHKKPGLPPDRGAAHAVISAMGIAPGLVIHSGHGLQAWWPFAECLTLESADDRRKARILARAWALTLKERARALGYSVDMTSDIARVLRVPGTLNGKDSNDIKPVLIVEDRDASYSVSDIEAVLLDGTWEQAEREVDGRHASGDDVIFGDLILDPQAEPPWEKFEILRELSSEVEQAWRRTRSKKTATWTDSEWEMSLASWAAKAGWEAQEIANLLIAARRKHGDGMKHPRYYELTIANALAGRQEDDALRDAVAVAEKIADGNPGERSESERADVLASLSKAIKLEITRVTRSPSEPPVFGIETPYGSGSLGLIKIIANNQAFRNRVGEITNRFPKRLKNEQWDPLAQALLQVAEPEDLGVETTLAGKAETLVSVYLGNHSRQVWSEMSEKTLGVLPIRQEPFVYEDGSTRIFLSGFRTWLAEHQHEQMTRTEIGTMLRAWGATSDTMHFRIDGKRTSRSVWILPNAAKKGVDG